MRDQLNSLPQDRARGVCVNLQDVKATGKGKGIEDTKNKNDLKWVPLGPKAWHQDQPKQTES